MAAYTAIFDACVLYSAPLRDLLLRLAKTELFFAKWTTRINEEWTKNLREDRPELTQQIERTLQLVNRSVPD